MTSGPSAGEFLEAVEELGPLSVFEVSGVQTALVCDSETYAFLLPVVSKRFRKSLISADQFSKRTRWRPGAKRKTYFVLSLESESEQISSLASQFPEFVFKGFVGDFLTAKSARSNNVPDEKINDANLDQSYAICCTARAGSTYLCELLEKCFDDHVPYENFRPSLIFLYQHRKRLNFDLRRWFDLTIQAQTRNRMFGTKVIGQFLSRMKPMIDQEDAEWLGKRIESLRPKIVYLRRQDKVEQAVSQYVARELEFWHLRDGRNVAANQARENEYRARKQSIGYDYEAIAAHYEGMVRAESRLQNMLEMLDLPIHKVTYEDLKADAEGTLAGILDFLKIPDAQLPEDLSTRIKRGFDSKNAELVQLFKQDLSERTPVED